MVFFLSEPDPNLNESGKDLKFCLHTRLGVFFLFTFCTIALRVAVFWFVCNFVYVLFAARSISEDFSSCDLRWKDEDDEQMNKKNDDEGNYDSPLTKLKLGNEWN